MSHFEWRRDDSRILIDLIVLRPGGGADLTSIAATAILDTGATTSGVSLPIVRELSLPTMAKRPINTANGLMQARRVLFRIGLPQSDSSAPFVFDDVLGFELNDGMSCPVLLGMDILGRCDFTMRRDGHCSLAFG